MTFTAGELPGLRRELVDYFTLRPYGGGMAGPGLDMYYEAIRGGKQPLRPPGDPARAAVWLSLRERRALVEADLWFVDADLCRIVSASHASMPTFQPQPPDLPSRTGMVLFAEPIDVTPPRPMEEVLAAAMMAFPDIAKEMARDPNDPAVREQLEVFRRIANTGSRIVAATWSPLEPADIGWPRGTWPAGGVWISFYSQSRVRSDGSLMPYVTADVPQLLVDNELAVAWMAPGIDPTRFDMSSEMVGTTGVWGRMLFAAFILARQTNLAETVTERTPRAERRRTERAKLPLRDVMVARLRQRIRPPSTGDTTTEVKRYQDFRAPVRGHWRNQWYPSLEDHRPKYIHRYIKGDASLPLRDAERVTIVDAP
jgi:hypothetical protein